MRIASFTMVGQFPAGIDLHVRNLKWVLNEEDHIFIITLPEYIEKYKLYNDDKVTYISFNHKKEESFINFWEAFPKILKSLNISPEYFLFMEQDIWFHDNKLIFPTNDLEIKNYLPLQKTYHATAVNGNYFHPRVWEGANLLKSGIVFRAIENKISFSFTKSYFFNRIPHWNDLKPSLTGFHAPDTFDEFSLYCALWEKTNVTYDDKACHLRGPESIDRIFPNYSEIEIEVIQKKLRYICVYTAMAVKYIAGTLKTPLDWTKISPAYKKDYKKLLATSKNWMNEEEYSRLNKIVP